MRYLSGTFDIVFASTSQRAIMTATIISNGKIFSQDERLLERGWGSEKHDGKETDEEAKTRIKNFIIEVESKYKGKRILIVTHGAIMRLAQNVIEENDIMQKSVGNCTIIKYNKNKEKIILNSKIQ